MSVIFLAHSKSLHSGREGQGWGEGISPVQQFGLRKWNPHWRFFKNTLHSLVCPDTWMHGNNWAKRGIRALCGLKAGGNCTRQASAFMFSPPETGNQFISSNTSNEGRVLVDLNSAHECFFK